MSNSNSIEPGADVMSGAQLRDPDIQDQASIFKTLVVTVQHFFGGFNRVVGDNQHIRSDSGVFKGRQSRGSRLFQASVWHRSIKNDSQTGGTR